MTGGEAVLKEGDVLLDAMRDYGAAKGRNSWDPMTAVLAVIGDEEKAGYDSVRGTVTVNPENGENSFIKSDDGLHKYIIKKFDDSYYAKAVNDLIV